MKKVLYSIVLVLFCTSVIMLAFLVYFQKISEEKIQNFNEKNSYIHGALGTTQYSEQILAAPMPAHFIYYFDISILGNYDSFYMESSEMLLSDAWIDAPSDMLPSYVRNFNYDYQYVLYEPNYTSMVRLLITHSDEVIDFPVDQLLELPQKGFDMRYCGSKLEAPSIYTRDEIAYFYGEDGMLYAIIFEIDDVTYTLTTYYPNYPAEGGNVIVDGFLSVADIGSAMAFLKLKAYIKLQQDPAYYTTIVIFTYSCLLGSIISLSAFVILGKRCKKKATMHQSDAICEPISEE